MTDFGPKGRNPDASAQGTDDQEDRATDTGNVKAAPDPDIIDYEAVYNHPETIDLSGEGTEMGMVIPVPIPEPKDNRGKRENSPIENHLRDVLCVHAVRSIYALEGIGISASNARDMVEKKLTMVGIEKAIRYGRKACTSIFDFESADQMEWMERNKHQIMPHLQGRNDSKQDAISIELKSLPFLDLAYSRARELSSGLYNSAKVKNPKSAVKERIKALTYRQAFPAPEMPEAVLISHLTRTNAAHLWQGFWFYRFVLNAVAVLGNMCAGLPTGLSAVQTYILFRLCENKPYDYSGHECTKHLVQNNMELVFGIEQFLGEAVPLLGRVGLLSPRPENVSELFFRCVDMPHPFLILYPRTLDLNSDNRK